jgi:hypothetical protein
MSIRSFLAKLYRLNLEKLFIKTGLDKRTLKSQNYVSNNRDKLNVENFAKHKERKEDSPLRFIHIGYPKAGSTALQRGFFGVHPQILHLGCGNNAQKNYWDDHGYISREINLAVEIDLRYRNQLAYNKDEVKVIFEPFFKKAKDERKYFALGLSNENFCFNWHIGIDTVEKARRLYDIFGEDTQIILVVRNQKEMIESLYKESIRFGYKGSFSDYLKYIWQYKNRNFYYDFHFDKINRLYTDLFGKKNVHILFFEDFRKQQGAFLESLSRIINIDPLINTIPSEFNKQLSNHELYIKRELNKKYPHTFEKGFHSPFDTHRYIPYYLDELEQDVEFEDYLDFHFRNDLCQLSKKLALKVDVQPIDLNWGSYFGSKILKGLSKANQSFQSETNLAQLEKYKYLSLS